jgi:hypothetical protein
MKRSFRPQLERLEDRLAMDASGVLAIDKPK